MFVVGGESSQWWGPMGVAVIWGLAVATFLTLVAVPVMYSSIDHFVRGLKWIFGGFARREEPAVATTSAQIVRETGE